MAVVYEESLSSDADFSRAAAFGSKSFNVRRNAFRPLCCLLSRLSHGRTVPGGIGQQVALRVVGRHSADILCTFRTAADSPEDESRPRCAQAWVLGCPPSPYPRSARQPLRPSLLSGLLRSIADAARRGRRGCCICAHRYNVLLLDADISILSHPLAPGKAATRPAVLESTQYQCHTRCK